MKESSIITPPNDLSRNILLANNLTLRAGLNGFFKENGSFICLLFYLMLEYVRPQSVYPQLDILPWAQLFFMATFGFMILEKIRWQFSLPISISIFSFFLWVLLSSIFANYPSRSFEYFKTIINWTLLFYMFVSIVNTRERFFLFFCAYLLFNFKMSQHAAMTWALRGFTFERWGISGTPGWFGNAADLGLEMVIFLPLGTVFMLSFYNKLPRYLKVISLLFPVTSFMAIIATGQRGTLLGLVAATGYLWWKSKNKFKSAIIIIVFALISLSFIPDAFLDRFKTMGSDETSNSRLKYWKRGLEMAADNPILGVGYENWVPYYAREFPGESLRGPIQEVAHSTPITVVAELGYIGFFFYYLIAWRILQYGNKIQKIAPKTSNAKIAFALNFGIIGYVISSVFITVSYYPFLWMQACMMAALYNITTQKPKNHHNE